jgi:hypothetical protein
MTYKESYEQIINYEDLVKEMKTDIIIAEKINPDRKKVILQAFKEVSKEKFNVNVEVVE